MDQSGCVNSIGYGHGNYTTNLPNGFTGSAILLTCIVAGKNWMCQWLFGEYGKLYYRNSNNGVIQDWNFFRTTSTTHVNSDAYVPTSKLVYEMNETLTSVNYNSIMSLGATSVDLNTLTRPQMIVVGGTAPNFPPLSDTSGGGFLIVFRANKHDAGTSMVLQMLVSYNLSLGLWMRVYNGTWKTWSRFNPTAS